MGTVDFFEAMNTASIMDFCSYMFADNRSSSLVLLSTLILFANSTFEGAFYFSQAPKVVDIPHREEKNDLFCGIFPHFLNSPTIS